MCYQTLPNPKSPIHYDRYEAWQLGGLARSLNQSIAAGPVTQALLDQAAVLLKVRTMSFFDAIERYPFALLRDHPRASLAIREWMRG